MTTVRGSLLASVLAITAFGFGVWVGPHLVGPQDPPLTTIVFSAPVEPAPVPPSRTPAATRVARTVVAPTSADLHARLRPVLNRGTDMDVAAQGFRDGEQFAAIAHAARNTEVPFLLLKHRVLNQGKSLAAAIRDSNPAIDASVQADLAVAQARVDIATIKG
jgi:hypothetical protein